MMKLMQPIRRWFWWALRLGLAGVFVYAGVMKMQDPARFAQEIAGYRLIPEAAGRWAAVYLPWLEVVAGAGLLLTWVQRGAAVILIVLLLAFIAALLSAWVCGVDVTCGCFGGGGGGGAGGGAASYAWLIARNLVLLGAAAVLAVRQTSGPSRGLNESQAI